jgi:hypothetical protein
MSLCFTGVSSTGSGSPWLLRLQPLPASTNAAISTAIAPGVRMGGP